MPYIALNICDLVVMKLCAKRQTLPLPSVATPRISLYQGAGKNLFGLQVVVRKGTLSAGSALFHDGCWSSGAARSGGRMLVSDRNAAISESERMSSFPIGLLLL